MRARIVFAALQTQNRYALCHLAFKSIRKFHKPSTRIQDTANDVLQRLAAVEQQRIGAEGADAFDDKQALSTIAPQAEPSAEGVDPGGTSVVFPAESPTSQSERDAPIV